MFADDLSSEERTQRLRIHGWKGPMDDVMRTHLPLIVGAVAVAGDQLERLRKLLRRKLSSNNAMDQVEIMYQVHTLQGRALWFMEIRNRFPARSVTQIHNWVMLHGLEGIDDMTLNAWGPHVAELEYPIMPLDWDDERFEAYNIALMDWLSQVAGAGRARPPFVPPAIAAQIVLTTTRVGASQATVPNPVNASQVANPVGAEPFLELVVAPDGTGRTVVEGHDLAVRFNVHEARLAALEAERGRGGRGAGRARGGRGRGAYAARGCYNCGAPDHYSRACPQPQRNPQYQQQAQQPARPQ